MPFLCLFVFRLLGGYDSSDRECVRWAHTIMFGEWIRELALVTCWAVNSPMGASSSATFDVVLKSVEPC